jgi:hypothetical protein
MTRDFAYARQEERLTSMRRMVTCQDHVTKGSDIATSSALEPKSPERSCNVAFNSLMIEGVALLSMTVAGAMSIALPGLIQC